MDIKYIDVVTKIYNEEYLKLNYQNYLDTNPNSNFIMIDMENFKSLNDNFGHNMGDTYLKVFGKILNSAFKDSIVVRLHGDEFAILTKYNEIYIEKILKLCNQKINNAFMEGIIPSSFNFNAGSSIAKHSIKNTKDKSDVMMYFAKRNKMSYQKFDSFIYEQKLKNDSFLKNIDLALRNDGFSYSIRELYNKDELGQNMYQTYTKDINGDSLFDNDKYQILRGTSKIQQYDLYNIQYILESIVLNGKQLFITIDNKSLLINDNIVDYLNVLNDTYGSLFKDIIISIDLFQLDSSLYIKLIEKINILKSMGYKVRLEKVDSVVGDKIIEDADIDYVKFLYQYWKSVMCNKKVLISIISKLNLYDKLGIVPIFDKVVKKEEFEFLKNNTPENTLYSGNYFSGEKKLLLKK